MMRYTGMRLAIMIALGLSWGAVAGAQPGTSAAAPLAPALRQALRQSLDRGLAYLRQQQLANGSWQNHPGLTAVVATSFLRYPGGTPPADMSRVDKALSYVVSFAKPDGGIYERDTPNYNTSVAIMALVSSGKAEYQLVIEKARQFLTNVQVDLQKKYLQER